MQRIGVVIIGRNEGERLKKCVCSVLNSNVVIVYVDSGSSDGSVEFVLSKNVHAINLDTSIPFSAGRARNEGMRMLMAKYPELKYIQFVDGDCEVSVHWLERASKVLANDSSLAIVCGRRRERYPEQSIYNQMCDIEWNTPIGNTKSCGGDFLAVVSALNEVGGFNPSIVAGEEPDMCYRLRQKGWAIKRIDEEMTLHDAKILRFSQWWKRTFRSGHAYAHNMVLHWGEGEKFNQRNILSIFFWGLFVPLVLILSLLGGFFILVAIVVAGYTVMILKIKKYLARDRGFDASHALTYGIFTMVGKIPQAMGALQFFKKFLRAEKFNIIEYK